MQELNLKLTIDEANHVLEGLGRLPFAQVYSLVAKIQAQAAEQLGQEIDEPGPSQEGSSPTIGTPGDE